MKEDLINNTEFLAVCRAATLKAFKGKVDEAELENFLASANKIDVPAPVAAKAGVGVFAIWGVVSCKPDKHELPWEFNAMLWGLGGAVFKSAGFMYTAYTNWEGLFEETTGFHAQGVADMGGIFQITWFNKKGLPVGQFNGLSGGFGAFEVGGAGKWKKK